MEGGQFGSFVWVLFVCFCCGFFFLCNDAPTANVDGVCRKKLGYGGAWLGVVVL